MGSGASKLYAAAASSSLVKSVSSFGITKHFSVSPRLRLLMLGLDVSGKTAILYKAKLDTVIATIPTIGFNVETIEFDGISFTVWDIGGQKRLRPLWRHYYKNVAGLVYVVDSADKQRLEEARTELFYALPVPDMQGVPVVIFANKQDLPEAATASELAKKLKLGSMTSRRWCIQPTCATSGEGIKDGFLQMADLIRKHQNKEPRVVAETI